MESHTWGIPRIGTDFVLLDVTLEAPDHSTSQLLSHVWRHRGAFAIIKRTLPQGPYDATNGDVIKSTAMHAVDYARLYISARPF